MNHARADIPTLTNPAQKAQTSRLRATGSHQDCWTDVDASVVQVLEVDRLPWLNAHRRSLTTTAGSTQERLDAHS